MANSNQAALRTLENFCTLDKLGKGRTAQVSNVSRDDVPLYLKLVTMGLVPGSNVQVSRVAPLGDPIAIRTTGHSVSLRLAEARMIEVIPSEGSEPDQALPYSKR